MASRCKHVSVHTHISMHAHSLHIYTRKSKQTKQVKAGEMARQVQVLTIES